MTFQNCRASVAGTKAFGIGFSRRVWRNLKSMFTHAERARTVIIPRNIPVTEPSDMTWYAAVIADGGAIGLTSPMGTTTGYVAGNVVRLREAAEDKPVTTSVVL